MYNDILWLSPILDVDIVQLVEAIVLPMTHRERFENIGIHPPKGSVDYMMHNHRIVMYSLTLQVCCCMEHLVLGRLCWPEPVQHRPR